MKYLVIIEQTSTGYSAYSPDLEGCISTGATKDEVQRNMRDAMEFHIQGMQSEGLAVPGPSSESAYVEVAAS